MSEPINKKPSKRPYKKPVVKTEKLTAVAALCNGTTSGGRKVSVGGPPVCTAGKLKS